MPAFQGCFESRYRLGLCDIAEVGQHWPSTKSTDGGHSGDLLIAPVAAAAAEEEDGGMEADDEEETDTLSPAAAARNSRRW